MNLGLKYIKTHGGLNESYFHFNDDEHYMDYDYDENIWKPAFGTECESGDVQDSLDGLTQKMNLGLWVN